MDDWIRRALGRLHRMPEWLQDLVLAVAVSEADLVLVAFSEPVPGVLGTVPRPAAVLVVLLVSLPLVFRRANPNLVMALTGFGAAGAAVLGIPIQALAPLMALYTVAAYLPFVDVVISTAIYLAVTTGLLAASGDLPNLYSNTLLVLGMAVIGRIVQANRAQSLELEARAAQLERSREAQARLAVTTERERIAREMHDVLAHSTSVMVVQAAGARRLVHRQPDRVAQALGVIEDTGRQSLGELRRMLGLLREDPVGEGDRPRPPQPGLGDLADLVSGFATAGLPVQLRLTRPLDPVATAVDASVALSAYRVVQEALTNAMKHADADRVTVDVSALEDRLLIEVLDDGGRRSGPVRRRHGAAATAVVDGAGGGFGLVGMRERVALVGGALEVGPRPGGGYRVAAAFPLNPADARDCAIEDDDREDADDDDREDDREEAVRGAHEEPVQDGTGTATSVPDRLLGRAAT